MLNVYTKYIMLNVYIKYIILTNLNVFTLFTSCTKNNIVINETINYITKINNIGITYIYNLVC